MPISPLRAFERGPNFFGEVKRKLNELISEVNAGGGGGAAVWGGITGIIASQSDLATALAGKQAAGSYAAASHTHTTSQITDFGTAVEAVVDGMGLSGGGDIDGGAAASTFGGLTSIDGGNASG